MIRAHEVVDDQHTSIKEQPPAEATAQSLYPSVTAQQQLERDHVTFPTTPRCLCDSGVDCSESAEGEAFSILGGKEEAKTPIHTSKAHIHKTSQHQHTHTHAYIRARSHTLSILNSSFFSACTSASSLCICRKDLIFSSASSPEIDVPPDREC